MVGSDDVSYGTNPKDAPNGHEKMFHEVEVDPNLVYLLGEISYDRRFSLLEVIWYETNGCC